MRGGLGRMRGAPHIAHGAPNMRHRQTFSVACSEGICFIGIATTMVGSGQGMDDSCLPVCDLHGAQL